MSKRDFVNPWNPLRVQGSDEKTAMQKLNTHTFPSIRPFPVPLDEGSHSLGQPTISWITLYFYPWFYDSTLLVCFPAEFRQHSSEAEGPRNWWSNCSQHTLTQSSGKRALPSRAWAACLVSPSGAAEVVVASAMGGTLCLRCCFFSGRGYGAKWARMNCRWMYLHRDLEVPQVGAPWCKKRRDT